MKSLHWLVAVLSCSFFLVLTIGCGSKSDSKSKPAASAPESDADAAVPGSAAAQQSSSESTSTNSAAKETAATNEDVAANTPFNLGDLIAPFTPPPLAELDKTAGWTDSPVKNGMEMMRKKQAALGSPPVSVEEALKLRNDSPENNAKILGTLSRLAPPDNAGVDTEATIVRHVGGDMKSANPLLMSTTTEQEFNSLTGFGVMSFDENFNHFAPDDLVVSWQTSKDHLVDKIVLRDDLTWSDGKPITAHDIAFTFKVIMTEAVPILAVRTGTDQIKWVEAYDDHTVVYFHKAALATNWGNLNFPIIPKHVYENSIVADPTMARSDAHTRLEDHPVTGGSYDLVKRVRNQEFVVRRRESYYMHNGKQVRPKPYFKEVRVKVIEDDNTALLALKGGQIDEMQLRPEQWVSQTSGDDFYQRNTRVTAPEWTEFHFVWNMKSPFFEDKRVRTAMSYAFDYDELLNKICGGLYQPAVGPFHPSAWYFPKQDGPKPYHQDLDKAEDLLDAAGWKDTDGDGIRDKEINGRRVPFVFSMLTFQTETAMHTATLMKECLAKIGITCNVKPTEFTVLYDSTQHHKFEASFAGLGCGADPDENANIFFTNESRNDASYSNKRVDELFIQGRQEFDRDKRAAIYGEIVKILWEDQPNTWLFHRNAFYGFNKNLRGYNFSPKGPFDFSPGFDGIFRAAAAP